MSDDTFKYTTTESIISDVGSELLNNYVMADAEGNGIWCGFLINKSGKEIVLMNAIKLDEKDRQWLPQLVNNMQIFDGERLIENGGVSIMPKIYLYDVSLILQVSNEISDYLKNSFNKKVN